MTECRPTGHRLLHHRLESPATPFLEDGKMFNRRWLGSDNRGRIIRAEESQKKAWQIAAFACSYRVGRCKKVIQSMYDR